MLIFKFWGNHIRHINDLVAVVMLLPLTPGPAGDVIAWETVSRPGMTTTFSTSAASVGVPRGQAKFDGKPSCCTARGLVAEHPGVCDHESPPVRSPVMRATGWRIGLTSVMTPPFVPLRVFWETTS